LAVHELRQLPGLEVPADVRLLACGQPLPDVGAEDRDGLVRQLLGVLRIEVLRPVDALVGVPLQPLPLLGEDEQLVALVLVPPGEGGGKSLLGLPGGIPGRERVATEARHLAPPFPPWGMPLRAAPAEVYGSPETGHQVTGGEVEPQAAHA